jgi:hypothetical protein
VAVGDLFAAPEAEPRDQRLVAGDVAQGGVGGGDAVRGERAVQDHNRFGQAALGRVAAPLAQPRVRGPRVGQRLGRDHRRARRRYCGRLGLGLSRARTPPAKPPPRQRAQRAHHEDVLGLVRAGCAHHVAPVGGAEHPRELELREAEVAVSRRRCRQVLPGARVRAVREYGALGRARVPPPERDPRGTTGWPKTTRDSASA